jgi:hypothetical protein
MKRIINSVSADVLTFTSTALMLAVPLIILLVLKANNLIGSTLFAITFWVITLLYYPCFLLFKKVFKDYPKQLRKGVKAIHNGSIDSNGELTYLPLVGYQKGTIQLLDNGEISYVVPAKAIRFSYETPTVCLYMNHKFDNHCEYCGWTMFKEQQAVDYEMPSQYNTSNVILQTIPLGHLIEKKKYYRSEIQRVAKVLINSCNIKGCSTDAENIIFDETGVAHAICSKHTIQEKGITVLSFAELEALLPQPTGNSIPTKVQHINELIDSSPQV